MTADLVTNILATTACAAAVLFVGRYLVVRWWESPEGWVTMALFGSLLLAMLLIVAGVWTGNSYPGRAAIRISVYSCINVMMWYAFYLLVTDQRRGRRK
jgi:hypothetical protein